jgi:hypothetical protein
MRLTVIVMTSGDQRFLNVCWRFSFTKPNCQNQLTLSCVWLCFCFSSFLCFLHQTPIEQHSRTLHTLTVDIYNLNPNQLLSTQVLLQIER